MYDIAIIGSGPAGMTAAIYAARANLRVLLLDKLAPGGQMINTYEIQNYPGYISIGGAELGIKMYEHAMSLGVTFGDGKISGLEKDGSAWRLLRADDVSATQSAYSVLIATGTAPRMLHVENEQRFAGRAISWCAICDGAKYRDKRVIVIGGGNSAVEESIYLAGLAKEVTLVTMFELTADPTACETLRAMPNVRIYPWHDVAYFLPGDTFTGLAAKDTKTGEARTIYGDGAFEYIGLKPLSEPFLSLGITDQNGYIEVDGSMRTRLPGVFAAGDVTAKSLRQVVTACADGALAANAMAKYVDSVKQA